MILRAVKNITELFVDNRYYKSRKGRMEKKIMKKVLTIGTIAALFVMILAAVTGSDAGFSLFMNTGIEHIIARAVLIGGLVAVAMTSRPRSKTFRTALGVISVLMIVFTAVQTLNYSLGLLDAVVYFLGGLLLSIESLEAESPTERDTNYPHTVRI